MYKGSKTCANCDAGHTGCATDSGKKYCAEWQEILKPCPFCGSRAIVYGKGPFYPRCTSGPGSGFHATCPGNQGWAGFETREKAIAAWNRRYVPTPETDEISMAVIPKIGGGDPAGGTISRGLSHPNKKK